VLATGADVKAAVRDHFIGSKYVTTLHASCGIGWGLAFDYAQNLGFFEPLAQAKKDKNHDLSM